MAERDSQHGGAGQVPGAAVAALYELTKLLRRECPWDQAQTAGTIVPHTLEEAYEVADAVAHAEAAVGSNDAHAALRDLEDELGDLLFQVSFLSMWCEEHDPTITLDSVASRIHEKLVRRHPHVFGDQQAASDADDVRQRWEAVKRDDEARGLFDGIPHAMPALGQARKVQQRAGSVGFDFGHVPDAMLKVHEEIAELEIALGGVTTGESVSGSENTPPDSHIVHEVGDVLFAAVNVARLARVDPEIALRTTTNRFRARVETAAQLAAEDGQDFTKLSLADQDAWYEQAKTHLQSRDA